MCCDFFSVNKPFNSANFSSRFLLFTISFHIIVLGFGQRFILILMTARDEFIHFSSRIFLNWFSKKENKKKGRGWQYTYAHLSPLYLTLRFSVPILKVCSRFGKSFISEHAAPDECFVRRGLGSSPSEALAPVKSSSWLWWDQNFIPSHNCQHLAIFLAKRNRFLGRCYYFR